MRLNIKDIVTKNTVFILIFVAAAFLRLYRLQAFVTFLGDQGRDAIIIKRIVTLEHLTAIGPPSSIGQVFLGPFYYYLVAPFLPLFHFNPVGLAFGVAFYSLIGFVLAYFIVKKQVNLVTALFFSVLLAFSAVNIDLSRFSWNPNLLPVFAFITLFFWYRTLKEKKWYFPFLFGIFFGASFQLHHLALLMGFPVFVTFLMDFRTKKKLQLEKLKKIGIAAVGFLILCSPLILFDLKNHFLNTLNLIKIFTQGEILNDASLHTSIAQRMSDTITALINNTLNVSFSPWLAILIFVLFIAGATWVLVKNKNDFLRLHLLNLILFTFAFGFLNSARHPHYYGSIYYSLFLIVAYKLQYISAKKWVKFSVIPLFFIVYIALNAHNYFFLYKQPNNQINDARRIAESIIPHIDKTPFQIVAFPIRVTDSHVRYFLEIEGHRPLEYDSPDPGQELFVLCFYDEPCTVIGNTQYQIAAFKNAKIESSWKLNLVTIYKLVHEKK
jgi:4-amino-4-deoxy-L-arabinose transferase-like glycosyltransferase